jgi:hypothetical protein
MNPHNRSTIIERPNRKLKIIQITHFVPFVPLLRVNFIILNPLIGTYCVSLDKQRLVILPLYPSLVVILVLDCDNVSVFLVLAPISVLVDPLTIVLRKSIEIYPNCARQVGYHPLRPI